MSRRDYAVKLFGKTEASASASRSYYSGSSSIMQNQYGQTGTTVRYGTVIGDSYEIDGKRYVKVLIDGSTDAVELPCSSTYKDGDRVFVEYLGNTVYVNVVSDNIVSESVSKAVEEVGNVISDEVAAEIQPIKDDFDAFKQDHQLTDEQINNSISDVVSTADAALKASSSAVQTVDAFQTTVNQKFESYDQGVIELGTRITQTEKAIQTEVSDRTEAVSGALQDAKSYTDQQADIISQTVESNVTSSIGQTYATKSELQQTSTDITATFEGAISDAKDEVTDEYQTLIRLSANGVEVGKASGAYKALMNSEGSYDIIDSNGNTLLRMVYEYSHSAIKSMQGPLYLMSLNGSAAVSIGDRSVEVHGDWGLRGDFNFQSLPTGPSYGLAIFGCVIYSNESGTSYGGSIKLNAYPSYFHTIEVVFVDTGNRYYSARAYNNHGNLSLNAFRLVFNAFYFIDSFVLNVAKNSLVATWQFPGGGTANDPNNSCNLKIVKIIGYGG